ncbi:lysophospholipid acyltransferase family protein [Sphingomonas montanisoli]|uniref:1-acyl-sn-glycerol-3-phosphate acyltransferase n=1 Tax=Sphingomonas montanisoli TaxID=2606412 RepID=A0A5D9C2A9_9SPHN|nr:lysophospholipid acyltransferase family protein [Sphingomonas montanisoli]TZG25978.1 1-acyl-sn-glycerol-3-phosphate acyltransferase [Sphingomonas montanisoli]
MITFIRSAAFAFAFYVGTALMVLWAVLIMPVVSRDRIVAGMIWSRFHRWCARVLVGIETRVEGTLPPGQYLIASKHQSMYETIELILIGHAPIAVLKRELTTIPLFGSVTRQYGSIAVDRAGSATALRAMLKAATVAKASGRSIMIFPEGTRVAPGDQPPLQAGFAGLYKAFGLPVIPVALDSGRVAPRNRFLKRPGVVTMRLGEIIPPGLKRDEIEARVHAAINALETA